jgi:hypothetical protein
MTHHERDFRALLTQDYEAAVRAYFELAVAEWLQDGPEEVVRILTFWATRSGDRPRIVLDHEILTELYLIKIGEDDGHCSDEDRLEGPAKNPE